MDEAVELLKRCATDLPQDVEEALKQARDREEGVAADVLDTILENIRLARETGKPMCQDTGTPIFHVKAPSGFDTAELKEKLAGSVKKATESVPLRPNAVDPVSGVNSGDNTGVNFPVTHFTEWDGNTVIIELMLKGGGSENVTQLYNLPDSSLDAGRDLDGVRKCVLDAVHRAQGKGCPPYIVGVGLGGLADETLALSKRQLLRPVGERSGDKELAAFEEKLLSDINALGIGPGGLGGKTTALDVKAGKQHRHPASFFVAVSLMCWACRRHTLEVTV